MTAEQYNEAEKIMNEIREIESFLKVFEEGHRTSITAYKRATTSLDRDRECNFPVHLNDYLYHAMADSMKKRIDVLNVMLEKI